MTADNLTARDIKRGLGTTVVGRRVRCYRSLASTMDTARRLAERGALEGTVVFAERQTQGRGRFNREWVSPPGLNITLSVILRPTLSRMRHLNMAATIAIVDAVHATTGLPATVKWPNDVRVGGRKVAGVLIEAHAPGSDTGYAVLGVGLNVNHDPTSSLAPPAEATSLAAATGRPVDRLPVLRAFLRSLDTLYTTSSDDEQLFQRWRGSLDTLGNRVRVAWGPAGAAVAEGVAVDVTTDGDIVLRGDDGSTATLNAGEVTVLPAGSR
jgi:BirA family biotin operon repressor/biotin-[acetyl-CoA-carboxylase] ligase